LLHLAFMQIYARTKHGGQLKFNAATSKSKMRPGASVYAIGAGRRHR